MLSARQSLKGIQILSHTLWLCNAYSLFAEKEGSRGDEDLGDSGYTVTIPAGVRLMRDTPKRPRHLTAPSSQTPCE